MHRSEENWQDIFKKPLKKGLKEAMEKDFSEHKSEHVVVLSERPVLHIPHINREELEHRFRVIKEVRQKKANIEPKKVIENIKPEKIKAKKIKAEKPKKEKKIKKTSTLREIFSFALTAATIFLVLFTGLNYQAFSQIVEKKLYPDKYTDAQIELQNALSKNNNFPKLLPTAGMKRENSKDFPDLNLTIAPLDNRIIIPKIGKNIPIMEIGEDTLVNEDWKTLEKEIQEGLRNGVVHYPGTAVPGQNGNTFITGHSSYYPWDDGRYKDVFALLHDLDVGDTFVVYWDQKKYDYVITERKVVSPEDTSVLDQPTDRKIATLMTCTPVGTAKNRLIIVAEEQD